MQTHSTIFIVSVVIVMLCHAVFIGMSVSDRSAAVVINHISNKVDNLQKKYENQLARCKRRLVECVDGNEEMSDKAVNWNYNRRK